MDHEWGTLLKVIYKRPNCRLNNWSRAGDLEIVEADLLADKPFHKAVLGVDYVFHLASPFFVKADDPDPETSLLKPAVQGTTNLFEAVVAADEAGHRVRRVVLTSSVAALKGRSPTVPKNGKAFTDQDWNETSTIDNGEAYWLSKVWRVLAIGQGVWCFYFL